MDTLMLKFLAISWVLFMVATVRYSTQMFRHSGSDSAEADYSDFIFFHRLFPFSENGKVVCTQYYLLNIAQQLQFFHRKMKYLRLKYHLCFFVLI